MAQFNYKLCWLHDEYSANFGVPKCQSGCSLSNNIDIPKCHDGCTLYTQCKRAFELAGLPNNYWYPPSTLKISQEDVEAMATTQHIRRNIGSFVHNGQNLWLYSVTSGNGKTYRAVTLATTYILYNVMNNNYFDNMVRYVYIPKYVADSELFEKQSFENIRRIQFYDNLETLYTSDLVIWDGFGYGSDSRIESLTIRAIINDRINNAKSNIFISDKSLQEVSAYIGRSTYQRIANSSLSINFRGPDLRADNIVTY